MDPEFMEPEYQVDEPIADFDMGNANDLDFEEQVPEENLSVAPSTVNSAQIDLDAVAKKYVSYALINRLLFIADICPPLRFDALKILIEYVMKNTQNIQVLMTAYQKVEAARQSGQIVGIEKIPPMDTFWIEQTQAKSQGQLEAYLLEFKRQKDEAVKESIRRSLDEVFHQHVHMGNIQEALKLFGRGMREYCTAPNYVLQMLINWINVTVYANQWPKLGILLPQAERAINEVTDRESVASSSSSNRGHLSTFPSSVASSVKSYKELVMSSKAKIAAVSGLAKMQEKQYKQAAEKFMTVDIDALDYPQLLAPSDVAVYATLCALATFTRAELKERVLGCTLFRKFLESEPKLVELLQRFCRSEFGIALDILKQIRDQLLLDMFLSPHINNLYNYIRQSAITQYFRPYLSANIREMAAEFRTSVDEMESELISLIEKGTLNARIDSYGKIVYARSSDNRADIYKRVETLRKQSNERVYAILLRAALQNHKVVVGAAEKYSKVRRRGNNYMMGPEGMDPMELYENETTSTSGAGSSTGSRVFAQVSKLFNAATSKIHPNQSATAESSSTSASQLASSSNGDNNEIIPAVPGGSGSGNSFAPSSSTGDSSRVNSDFLVPGKTGGMRPSNGQPNASDMEMDENLGDI